MVKMKNLLCCDVTRGCHRGPQKFLEIVSSTMFILWSLLPHTAVGFGQGTMIENSFESTYCRNGVSVLSRGPVHYDLRRCGGQCSSSRAPRDMYRMVVNSTTYSVDNVQGWSLLLRFRLRLFFFFFFYLCRKWGVGVECVCVWGGGVLTIDWIHCTNFAKYLNQCMWCYDYNA